MTDLLQMHSILATKVPSAKSFENKEFACQPGREVETILQYLENSLHERDTWE